MVHGKQRHSGSVERANQDIENMFIQIFEKTSFLVTKANWTIFKKKVIRIEITRR